MDYVKSWWYGPSVLTTYLFGPGRTRPDPQKTAQLTGCAIHYVSVTEEELKACLRALRPVKDTLIAPRDEPEQEPTDHLSELRHVFATGGPQLRHIAA